MRRSPSMTPPSACRGPTYPTIPHMAGTLPAVHATPAAGRISAMPPENGTGPERELGPYVELSRDAWAELGAPSGDWGPPLTAEEIEPVRGLGDELDLD